MINLKESAQKTFRDATEILSKDLASLPESAFNQKFSDKTRTVADIIYEIILVNKHVGMVIRNEKPFDWPEGGWITAPENQTSKDTVTSNFKNSCQEIMDTINRFTEEDFADTVETESGPTSKYARIQFMALHMWYHSGQINYIQTLLGDDNWNW